MGTMPLRRFLQSLCNNSCWNYAVFWKLEQETQMFLMWEDGYFGTFKAQDPMESITAEASLGGLEGTSLCNGTFGGDAVELAVAYMSSFQYALGDGVVGDVAYTGNHRWVFAGSKPSGEFNTASIPEHSDEWLFQFAAGIKTILLVPVIPHGVLQLGSLEELPEDAEMANRIKSEFIAHQDFMGCSDSFAMNKQFLSQSPSSLMSTMMNSLDEFPSIMVNAMRSDDSTTIEGVNWSNHKHLVTPPSDMLKSSAGAHLGAIELPGPLHQSTFSKSEVIESSKSGCLEEEVPVISYHDGSSTGILEEYADRPLRPETLVEQPLVSDNGPFLCFPKECELHKALGPSFVGKANDSFQYLSISEDVYSSSSHVCSKDLVDSSSRKSNGVAFYEENMQDLLGNVVTSALLGENCSIRTSGQSSLSNSIGAFSSLAKRKISNQKNASGEESALLKNHVESAFYNRIKNLTDSSSPSATSFEGIVNELTEDDILHQRKGQKPPSTASKRRGKPGAKQKPRPRDRQLIQDRLKELRELVPDGAKCSIDGLLHRTVAHMHFLKSVGDRAIKLKQCVQPEGGGTGLKGYRTPDDKGSQNGASWAFELGGDLNVCPIIVEDLQYSGHMIIEMICNESSRFLEIAEVIRGLDLTILKGAMERRSGNTWARFVIEAPRGFHRLDIFWPLMKLLQQQHSPICSKI